MPNLLGRDRELMPNLLGIAGTTVTPFAMRTPRIGYVRMYKHSVGNNRNHVREGYVNRTQTKSKPLSEALMRIWEYINNLLRSSLENASIAL
jgi:hypothetical protein